MSNSAVGASSATYRKAVNNIAEAIKSDPKHSKYPSDDLSIMIDEIPDAMKAKAIEWYERGVKRGMAKATDLMLDGKIYMDNENVHAPDIIKVKTKIKMSGGDWERKDIIIKATDIGFDLE